MTQQVQMNDIITFGKFKHRLWKDIFYSENSSYLNWCRKKVGIIFPQPQNTLLNEWMQKDIEYKRAARHRVYEWSTGDIHVDYDLGLCGQF